MTLLLTSSDVNELLDRAEVLTRVERVHRSLTFGDAVIASPGTVTLGNHVFVPMTAGDAVSNIVAVKLLADMPADGGWVQRSTIMACSADTGECEAILDGRVITAARTAAASAVATKHLARQDSHVLGLVGAGNLAVEHAQAINRVRDIREVVVWSRSTETIESFRARSAHLGIPTRVADTAEAVTKSVDVLCTLTPSKDPVVRGAWFTEGLHVNVVGAPPRTDHREVDGEAMRLARVVVDSVASTMRKSGDTCLAIREGAITGKDVADELGDVIAGRVRGRTDDRQITLFNSIGLAVQDAVVARLLIDLARDQGVGRDIDLRA